MTTTQHQSKHGGARVHFPPPMVFVGLMGVAALVQWLVVRVTVPIAPLPRFVLAAIFGLPGIALTMSAHGLFKRSGQNPVPWMPSPELVLTGIYRFTRNPMYLGMTLVTIGIACAANDVWMIAAAFVGLVVVHVIAVLPEEAYLGEKFGDAYARYKSKVRRYL
jgi:protein-S-isoprenylcysteine O-methyltransferase Ste14